MVHYFTSQYDSTQRKIVTFLGVVFLVLGTIMIANSMRLNFRMDNSRQVSARVVEVIEPTSNMYKPVYEYSDGGEVKKYTSTVSTSNWVEIGSETTLYITEDGKIYERLGVMITLFVGIGFEVIGVMCIFAIVIMRIKLPKRRKKAS